MDRDEWASLDSAVDSVPDELLLRRIFGRAARIGTPPGVGGTSAYACDPGVGGCVTSARRDGRERFLGRPLVGAMASAGVFGGPAVRGVLRVTSDTSELVDSTVSDTGAALAGGRVSESESRLGLDRFIDMTDGSVEGNVEVVMKGVADILDGKVDEVFMVIF